MAGPSSLRRIPRSDMMAPVPPIHLGYTPREPPTLPQSKKGVNRRGREAFRAAQEKVSRLCAATGIEPRTLAISAASSRAAANPGASETMANLCPQGSQIIEWP